MKKGRANRKWEDQTHSQSNDEDGNDGSPDSSYDIEEDGLDKDEFVDDTGKSITADQVCETLTAVLKKHQKKLNQDLEDMAQISSFEEEGVFISEEESIEEDDDMETE